MASETDQLTRDFEEVNKLLTQYPQIHVAQTEGDPPAAYEVEYQLTGLIRQTDGSIGQGSRHLLRISLPFGYPHFPPTVKPLTSIFHPDVDPDAVRIASYWQQNPSLAELMVHMGEMICAKSYNLEEPFNQEAADWYSEHSSEFPLDEIQQGSTDFEVDELSLEDDSDLGLSLEIDDQQENIDEQLEEIQSHIDRNEVVIAGKLLTTLSSSSPEAQRLEKIVSSTLSKRDKLIQKLEELENEDRFTEAYAIFKKVREIAIDTPALSDIGERLQQSQAMLDTFSQPNPTADKQNSTAIKSKKGAKKKEKKPLEKKKEKEKISRNKNRAPIVIPIKPILTGIVLLSAVGGCTLLYTNDMDKMTEANRNWIEVKYQSCTTPDQFRKKRIQAEKLLVNLKSIYVPGLGQKKLEAEIHEILTSPDFKKGETGDEEYKGSTLPASVIKKLEPVDKKINQAASAIQKEQFTEALSLYQEALSLAEIAKPGALEPHSKIANSELDKRIKVIQEKIATLQTQAGQEERLRERRKAEKRYQETIAFFQELKRKEIDPSNPEDKDVTADQWGGCAERSYETQRLLSKYPAIDSPERQKELQSLVAYSRLYQKLEIARQAYEGGELENAISEYQGALRLLKEERSALDAIYNDAVLKVGQTVVMLSVSLELREAVKAENNDLRSSLAHYKKTLRTIRTSQVARMIISKN
ncbi:Ubiquitin-conjugating enzyme [Candidatus Electrothrix aarhusensis]|uniref:Ubiquitin-conjugating enzyme n=1 Tax=Candidatus Electrothrix aarhusensis TaxID=1859131 RepID=A0A444IQ25_9BACT|nr:Ubiquitin-conjugating enzyme [Candidatus Electrothrix aarhusensis]